MARPGSEIHLEHMLPRNGHRDAADVGDEEHSYWSWKSGLLGFLPERGLNLCLMTQNITLGVGLFSVVGS
jgi:hypothetical protein